MENLTNLTSNPNKDKQVEIFTDAEIQILKIYYRKPYAHGEGGVGMCCSARLCIFSSCCGIREAFGWNLRAILHARYIGGLSEKTISELYENCKEGFEKWEKERWYAGETYKNELLILLRFFKNPRYDLF